MLAYITSQGVMNSPKNRDVRDWLMNNTNLVSAIRLPNNLFIDSANTEVGSYLIILQINSNKTSLTEDEKLFVETATLIDGINSNSYFRDMESIVHTSVKIDTDQYGKPAKIYLHDGGMSAIAFDMCRILTRDINL